MPENSVASDTVSPTPPPPLGQPYGAPRAKKPKRRVRVWVVVLLVILGILVGTLVGNYTRINSLLSFQESIGVIDLDGTIGQDSGANTPEGLLAQLQSAANDPSVAAVVLRVNSGGGAAAAGEEMAQYVKDFSKPIVVSTASANASAAYLISAQADYIYANEASSVGSIGTVMQVTDYSKLLDLLGIDVRTITSADSKDASYGHRPLTDEEVKYFQEQVDQINKSFIASVAEGRGMEVSAVEQLATGMVFTGADGVENGLIDEIGTYKDACNKAAALSGIGSYGIKYLGSDELGLADVLSVLFSAQSEQEQKSSTSILEGASTNGQLS